MPFSNAAGLDILLGWWNTSFLALHVADPTGQGLYEVPTGSGYARVAIKAYFDEPTSKSMSNNVELVFPTVASQYTARYWGLWASETSTDPADFQAYGTLSVPMVATVGNAPRFPISRLSIRL